MTTNLNTHRLLKDYRSLAAAGYPGGAAAFSDLADLAGACLTNVTTEQRLPAMILQNIFLFLSQECGARDNDSAEPIVSPAVHRALSDALQFLAAGGSPTRCIQVSEALIRVSEIGQRG